jgi:hypothetical protein
MDPITPAESTVPSLSIRAIRALSTTQRWARFAGTVLFGMALLELIQGGIEAFHFHATLEARPLSHIGVVGGMVFYILSNTITLAVYCATGWFALRYAERLNRVRPPWQPTADDIANALGAQHRYWRLQGVLWIISISLLVLMMLAVIVVVAIRATR